jgi:hypothetical protein
VWAGQAVSYPIKEMVRSTAETVTVLPYPAVAQPARWLQQSSVHFYLAIPGWLFFLNAQRGYDPQAQRNSRQEFALCAYAGMLGTAAFLVLLYLIKFQVSRLLILNLMLMGIAFLWVSRTVVAARAASRTPADSPPCCHRQPRGHSELRQGAANPGLPRQPPCRLRFGRAR